MDAAAAVDCFKPDDRVTVRHRLDDGSATDVVGWVTAIDAKRIEIVSPVDRLTTVERDRIILAKRVPAAMGGRPPSRISAEELEQAACASWIADSEPLGDWTLRSGNGFSGRANSCLAVGDPGLSYARAAKLIIDYFTERELEPRAQVIAGSQADGALRDLGWQQTYVATMVMAQPLVGLLADHPRNPGVEITSELTERWWQAYLRFRPVPDHGVARRILSGVPPVGLAAISSPSGGIKALGRGQVSRDWLGLAALWTDPDHRHHGLATMIMRELGHWAARYAARNVYLQVAKENAGAIAAYSRLGFEPHHDYLYLRPPG